jgi:hypothetical protein
MKANKEFEAKRQELIALIAPYEKWLGENFGDEITARGEAWKRLRESVGWAEDALKYKILLAKKKVSK